MAEALSRRPLKAVVLGGTGAVGREVVGQLLCSPLWGEVATVGRRPTEVPAAYSGWDLSKLKQVVLGDLEEVESAPAAAEALRGADSVFCALGTTRGTARSAAAFRRVDLTYVEMTARAAKAAGVPHFSLVSAQGANARVPASDWAPLHGLLYMKTKGLVEQAVREQGFKYTTILRPGMLERGELARGGESFFSKLPFISSVGVAHVAHVMLAEAERCHLSASGGETILEMKDIQKYSL